MNERGFGLVEGMLILLVICAVGFGGWHVVKQNSSEDVEVETSQVEASVGSESSDELEEQAESVVIDYSKWEEQSGNEIDGIESTEYGHENASGSLIVYEENPIIFYSSNAPVYCRYENSSWVSYSAVGTNPIAYSVDSSSDACESIDSTEINGENAHTRFGGALGQTSYAAVIAANDQWLVFSDYINQDNVNLPEEEVDEIENKLRDSVEQLVVDTIL